MSEYFKKFNIMIDDQVIARVDAVNEHDAAQYARDHFGEHATVLHLLDGGSVLD